MLVSRLESARCGSADQQPLFTTQTGANAPQTQAQKDHFVPFCCDTRPDRCFILPLKHLFPSTKQAPIQPISMHLKHLVQSQRLGALGWHLLSFLWAWSTQQIPNVWKGRFTSMHSSQMRCRSFFGNCCGQNPWGLVITDKEADIRHLLSCDVHCSSTRRRLLLKVAQCWKHPSPSPAPSNFQSIKINCAPSCSHIRLSHCTH
jgi:hypothetical protein